MLAQALKTSGSDRAKLRDALESQEYVGTNGVFHYTPEDHDGLGKEGLVWVEIKDGKFRLMK